MWAFNYTVMLLLNPASYLYIGQEKYNEDLIVDTKYGKLLGGKEVARNGREFYSYRGIPYAKPPIRYASPQPPEPWTKVRDARAFGSKCAQVHLFTRTATGSEDCLFLNVYTHQIQGNGTQRLELHPVMFYIHGGAFMGGSGDAYGPDYIMDHDVVLVTINYRLASFGFLNTGHEEAQGNMGLKDQVMALKWVKENIDRFGGDPQQVTIAGQSAGGVCAHFHTLSEMSQGLFHRVISQSGTALAPWAINSNPIQQSQHFASKVNCSSTNVKEMIDCLKKVNASVLVEIHLNSVHFIHESIDIFRPTVELLQNENTFLLDSPLNLLRKGKVAAVPFLTGVNSHEGLVFAAPIVRNATINHEINSKWYKYAPQLCGYEHELPSPKERISTLIKDQYLQDQVVTMENVENVANMMSDRNWFQGIHNLAVLYRENQIQAPLYLYYFSYKPEFSLGNLMLKMTMNIPVLADVVVSSGREWFSKTIMGRPDVHYGAGHTDEVGLLYNMPFKPEQTNGSKDFEMSKLMVGLWTSFVKNGAPNAEWPPANEDIINASRLHSMFSFFTRKRRSQVPLKYYMLDKDPQVIEEPFNDRVRFWNSLRITYPFDL